MKLFLDTANVKEISFWAERGIIDGVTTNPSLLSKENAGPKETIAQITHLLPDGKISVEVTEKEPEAVYKQAKAIAQLSPNILVKIPCHRSYYAVIDRLVKEGVPLNITLVFSLSQALMMCKLGVDYLSPFVGRLDDADSNGIELLCQIRLMLDEYDFDTNMLAASIRSVERFHEAILAGSDAVTVPISVLEKATEHVLTDRGIELFDADWKKIGVREFP